MILPREVEAAAINAAASVRFLSPDPSTQIGAVILAKHGDGFISACNTFPSGIAASPERLKRPAKYAYVEHAERNAIFTAARMGISLEGATLFLVGMGPPTHPCTECARAIIGAGIERVTGAAYKPLPEHWDSSCSIGGELLAEAGIVYEEWTEPLQVENEQSFDKATTLLVWFGTACLMHLGFEYGEHPASVKKWRHDFPQQKRHAQSYFLNLVAKDAIESANNMTEFPIIPKGDAHAGTYRRASKLAAKNLLIMEACRRAGTHIASPILDCGPARHATPLQVAHQRDLGDEHVEV